MNSIVEENHTSVFQSKMTLKESYEAENNPVQFLIEFSESVPEINPSFFHVPLNHLRQSLDDELQNYFLFKNL